MGSRRRDGGTDEGGGLWVEGRALKIMGAVSIYKHFKKPKYPKLGSLAIKGAGMEDEEEEKDALVFVLALVPVLFPVFCFGRA